MSHQSGEGPRGCVRQAPSSRLLFPSEKDTELWRMSPHLKRTTSFSVEGTDVGKERPKKPMNQPVGSWPALARPGHALAGPDGY